MNPDTLRCTECGHIGMKPYHYKPAEYIEKDDKKYRVVKHRCPVCGYLRSSLDYDEEEE